MKFLPSTIMQYTLGKPPRKNHPRHLGIARLGGGGLNPCPDGLGQLFWEDFASFWGGLYPCPDGLGHFFGDKLPQSARLSAGRGVQKLFGQCPNAPCMNLSGASLTLRCFDDKINIVSISLRYCDAKHKHSPCCSCRIRTKDSSHPRA